MAEVVPLLKTVDYHTAGEPFRIVTDGFPGAEGDTVATRRELASRDDRIDAIRRALCHEPRGHADMYGGFIVPPDDDGAHFGVLFWHKDGFSTACGHGTIALGVWAVDSGLVAPSPDGTAEVVIDVPSGRVRAFVRCHRGRPQSVTFRNVASYVLSRKVEVRVGGSAILADISYGGAIYASVDASQLGLHVSPQMHSELITVGREVKRALRGSPSADHPEDPRLSGIYGTILFEELADSSEGGDIHQRNVTIFADGQVDRSPCGSGTSARMAVLVDEDRMGLNGVLLHESIIGARFTGRVLDIVRVAGRNGVLTEVTGMAYLTGEHSFVVDPADPLGSGFVLR
ncbi:MAG TPA: proline racemase family protein [Nocardioidaceae bacterium]|nr:proline racemase family protein [Nocardioidaceae bacterium]